MDEEENLNKKQLYLRTEILEEGYDPQEFNDYMCSIRNEENIDLNNWTLEELTKVVNSFKARNNDNNENEKEQENIQIENKGSINDQEPEPEIKEKTNSINMTNLTQSTIIFNPQNDAYERYERRVICQKLEKNNITDRDDLYIFVTEPQRVKPGFFSISYYQYVIKVYPLNIQVVRKVSDFYILSQKLPLIDPVSYIPELPTFSFGVKDDSPEKIRFYQNYMNLLIENKYLRSLPIVYDFITLPQNDWNNKLKKVYSNIKEPQSFSSIPNLEGEHFIRITKEEENKANNIKNDIYAKNEIYSSLDGHFDELFLNLDKVSFNLKNISLCFKQLLKKYKDNNKILYKGYINLYNAFKVWSDDYLIQKNLIKEEIKYFFLFISKELNTFLNNYENYRMARDDYKKTFDKLKKNKNPSNEDLSLLKSAKKYYGFELVQVNNEYNNLVKRQGRRLINQFMKYRDSKNILLQDLKNCCGINNFQKLIDLQEEEKEKEQSKKDKNNINENENKEKDTNNEEEKIDIIENENNDNNKSNEKKEEKEEIIITTDNNNKIEIVDENKSDNLIKKDENEINEKEKEKENDNNTKIKENKEQNNNNINEINIENKNKDTENNDNIIIDEKIITKNENKDKVDLKNEDNKEDKSDNKDINNENEKKDIKDEEKKEEIKKEDNKEEIKKEDDNNKDENKKENNIENNNEKDIKENSNDNSDKNKENKENEIKDNIINENNNNIIEKEDNEKKDDGSK